MTEIENYVTKRYERWLDYVSYHCAMAGIEDEATDVLNEVMSMLLAKPHQELEKMYQAKKGQYRELDFFVLRMIKINATSITAPYRSKNKSIPKDANTDYTKLDIIDETDNDTDRAGVIMWRMRIVRFIFDRLELSEFDRAVFEYHFFQDGKFTDWPKTDTLKNLYSSYSYTRAIIQRIVCALGIGKPVAQPKGITQSMKRRIIKASRQFIEKTDKRLLNRIKNIDFMEDEEFDNELLKSEEQEAKDFERRINGDEDNMTEEDYRKLMDGDDYRTVGVADIGVTSSRTNRLQTGVANLELDEIED